MPVLDLASFVTVMLVLVREDILGRGLDLIVASEARGLGPPEALGCLAFEPPKI